MEIPKPTQADKDYFLSLIPQAQGVEVKPMFGNLGAFVNGNMFAGLFGALVGVRLSTSDHEELSATGEAGPFGPAQRPMGGYLSLPEAWHATPDVAASWVDRAYAHVSTMPPKASKPKKARS
jgi:TfoX/Sxy family transcriptional regulator of competence genes